MRRPLGIETVHQDLALCDNLVIVQNMFLRRETVRHFTLDEEAMETLSGLVLLAAVTIDSVARRNAAR